MKYIFRFLVFGFVALFIACKNDDDGISIYDLYDLQINQNLIGSWEGIHLDQEIDGDGNFIRSDTFQVAFTFNDDASGIYSSSTEDCTIKDWGISEGTIDEMIWVYEDKNKEPSLAYKIELNKVDSQIWFSHLRQIGGASDNHDFIEEFILKKVE